jgi:hypothetical protein
MKDIARIANSVECIRHLSDNDILNITNILGKTFFDNLPNEYSDTDILDVLISFKEIFLNQELYK